MKRLLMDKVVAHLRPVSWGEEEAVAGYPIKKVIMWKLVVRGFVLDGDDVQAYVASA